MRERHREACGARSADPEYRKKMREAASCPHPWMAARNKVAGEARIGKKCPKQSEAMKAKWADPEVARMYLGVIGTNHQPEYLDRRGRLWRFKSTWELRFARWLDERELSWRYEPDVLLLSDGRRYVPDFWVDEWATYLEMKGRHDSGKAQVAAADGHPVLLLKGRAVEGFYRWARRP